MGQLFLQCFARCFESKQPTIKNQGFTERLSYVFEAKSEDQMELSLLWENWKIPMTIE